MLSLLIILFSLNYYRDVKASLEHYKGLEKVGGKDLNITESSGLIELLVKDDLIEEAVDVTERMLSREAYPMPRIFRFLLNRLASRYKNTKILL